MNFTDSACNDHPQPMLGLLIGVPVSLCIWGLLGAVALIAVS